MSQVQVARLVHVTTQEISPTKLLLPSPIITVFTAFHKVHGVWRWYRKGKIYSNPDNFLKLAAGHSLNSFTNSTLLRIASVCVLIATRILECVEQQAKLQRAWGKWTSSFKGNFPTPVKCTWKVKARRGFFSASTIIWFTYHGKDLILKVEWIAISTFQLGKQTFLLSMRIMDAIESFSLSPKTGNEGMNELFVNGTKWIDKLVENKELLADGLVSNKALITKILTGIHSPFSADQLITTTKETLDQTEKLHKTTEKVSHTAGVFLSTCAKKWGHEFLYNLGLQNLVPRSYIPPSTPPWEKPRSQKMKARFPPDDWITKPSLLPKESPELPRKPTRIPPQKKEKPPEKKKEPPVLRFVPKTGSYSPRRQKNRLVFPYKSRLLRPGQ